MGLPPVAWLSDPDIAIWSAVLANVWRGTAFSMILLYAGLLVIPREPLRGGRGRRRHRVPAVPAT